MRLLLLLFAALIGVSVAQLSTINDAIGHFSVNILKRTLTDGENTIHSSYSIWSALAMCLVGSRDATTTVMQNSMLIPGMSIGDLQTGFTQSTQKVLLAAQPPNNGFKVSVANRIYVNESYPVSSAYLSTLNNVFRADALNVNFKTNGNAIKDAINSFVANATNNLIPQVLPDPLSADTIMALINALYFKGPWRYTMNPNASLTKFNAHLNGGQTAKWLSLEQNLRFGSSPELDAQIVEIPYAPNANTSDQASMVIVLPAEAHKNNITQWAQSKLNWAAVASALGSLGTSRVRLTMPEMNVESSFELSSLLQQLGMVNPFSNAANFDGMVTTPPARLKIDKVIHRAKMTVDRNGTEAAAVTVITMIRTTSIVVNPPPVYNLDINRSFVAFIVLRQNNSTVPLFTSVINKV